MASPTVAAVHKASLFSDTGISFYDDAGNSGNVFVLEIRAGGLFESTPLQAGMRVVSVNNTSTQGMTAGAVSKMVDGTEGMVTILAQEASTLESSYATALPTAPPAMYASHGAVTASTPVLQAQLVQEGPYVQQQYPAAAQQQPVVNHQVIIQQPNQEVPTIQKSHSGPAPPPGVSEGGEWGVIKYRGSSTWAWSGLGCFLTMIPWCLLCPHDEKPAYRWNSKMYDTKGKFIGSDGKFDFEKANR
jgi:hypothetical protein